MSRKGALADKDSSQDRPPLLVVLIADSFTVGSSALQPNGKYHGEICLANIPVIDLALAAIARMRLDHVVLAVRQEHNDAAKAAKIRWASAFTYFGICAAANALSVGDLLRELNSRKIIQDDFLLVTSPFVLFTTDLSEQLKSFRERRAKHRDNVMTLLYARVGERARRRNAVGIEKGTNKLMCYHTADDPTRLDFNDDSDGSEWNTRTDLADTGLAFCAINVSAQFTDNFDFQERDEVIRELLVNEEILGLRIHVDILPDNQPASMATDINSIIFIQSALLGRWFFPLVPERIMSGSCRLHARLIPQQNIYIQLSETSRPREKAVLPDDCWSAAIGKGCSFGSRVTVRNASVGANTSIGESTVIRESIVGTDCKIGSCCTLRDVYLCKGVSVDDGVAFPRKCYVGENVHITESMKLEEDSVIHAIQPGEDYESQFIAREVKGCDPETPLYQWTRVDGINLWDSTIRKRRESESSRKMPVARGDSGPNAATVVDDDVDEETLRVGHFVEEIADSMRRMVNMPFVQSLVANLILEINSSKLAYNISIVDVAKHVWLTVLGLPQTSTTEGLLGFCRQWKGLLANYYKPTISQNELLVVLEERAAQQPSGPAGKSLAKVIHFLNQELEVLDDNVVLTWFRALDDDSPVRPLVKALAEWLESDDEDEDEEEEEEEDDSEEDDSD